MIRFCPVYCILLFRQPSLLPPPPWSPPEPSSSRCSCRCRTQTRPRTRIQSGKGGRRKICPCWAFYFPCAWPWPRPLQPHNTFMEYFLTIMLIINNLIIKKASPWSSCPRLQAGSQSARCQSQVRRSHEHLTLILRQRKVVFVIILIIIKMLGLSHVQHAPGARVAAEKWSWRWSGSSLNHLLSSAPWRT